MHIVRYICYKHCFPKSISSSITFIWQGNGKGGAPVRRAVISRISVILSFSDTRTSKFPLESSSKALLIFCIGWMISFPTNDEQTMAAAFDQWLAAEPDQEILLKVYDEYIAGSSYEDSQITYTDYVAMLTSSITTIIDGISYVLVAFVAISLIVSCIMIGIITHISVMERTKEIGILRTLGASKRNISQVFNAETFIIGCCAGLLGIGGLLPAKKAAKKDSVIALRTE